CAQDPVLLTLADQILLVGALEGRALGEVVRAADSVLGRHRGERSVLLREVHEARVRIADHKDASGPVRLATAVELAEQWRVGRAVLLTDRAVRRDTSAAGGVGVVIL